MRIQDHPGTAAAFLLAGMAALQGPLPVAPNASAERTLPLPGTSARMALEWCRENVSIIHDVHWATACATQGEDDSPDCTLPDDRASILNADRAQAEDQCLADAVAGDAAGAAEAR
jgi:hypothetical protein